MEKDEVFLMIGVKANLDKNILHRMFIEENKTKKEIAEYFNVSVSAVKTYLRKFNIKREEFSVDKNKLYQLYIVEDKSQVEVADILGICKDTVCKYLRLYGISKPKGKNITKQDNIIQLFVIILKYFCNNTMKK